MKHSDFIKIGGEFEIDPHVFDGLEDYRLSNDYFLYSNGSSALKAILNHIKTGGATPVIHLPYYICHNVVNACLITGFNVFFYEPDENFLFPTDYLIKIKRDEALLTVNYFGFIDDNISIESVKTLRPDITCISDQVQSFWNYKSSKADYSFTSLRKHFAVPGGALIHSKERKIEPDFKLPEAHYIKDKLIGSFLKYLSLPDRVYLQFFEDGEDKLVRDEKISKAPSFTYYLYDCIDIQSSIVRRKENCKLIYEIGSSYGLSFLFPFSEDVIPLNVPITLENRDKVRKKLMSQNIFLPVHWPIGEYNILSPLSQRMAHNELSLIVDQRYSSQDIENELKSLIKIIKHG